MELDNLTLAYLAEELNGILEGSFLNKVQEIDKGIFKFKFRTKEGSKDLIAVQNAIYLTDYKIDAKQFATGYASFLKKRILRQKVQKVEQIDLERILMLELQDYYLVFELFGNGNIILLDKEKNILMPLHRETWKDRVIKKNVPYELPPSKGLDPSKLNAEDLKKLCIESKKDFIRTIISGTQAAPIYVEDVFMSLKLDKSKEAKKAHAKELESIAKKLKQYYAVKRENKAYYIISRKDKEYLSPIKLKSFPVIKETNSINETLDELFSEPFLKEKKEKKNTEHKTKAKAREHNLKQQLEAKEKFEKQEKEFKEAADKLYQNYAQLQELEKTINQAINSRMSEKEIMYKIDLAVKQGLIPKNLVEKIDIKNKKLILNI